MPCPIVFLLPALLLLPGITWAQEESEIDILSAENLAALMIRHVELEMELDRMKSEVPAPCCTEPIVGPEPSLSDIYEAATVNGNFKSSFPGDLTEAERARLPESTVCEALGDWFLSLDLARDFDTFFVREDESLRICFKSAAGWKVGRTGGNRTHVIYRR